MRCSECVLKLQRGSIQDFNVGWLALKSRIGIHLPPHCNDYVSRRSDLDLPGLRLSFFEGQVAGPQLLQRRGIQGKELACTHDEVPTASRHDTVKHAAGRHLRPRDFMTIKSVKDLQ